MEIRIMEKGKLQIDNARIIYRNFRGEGGRYNREGDKNFAVVIDDVKWSDLLADNGWNVKIKPPREDGDEPFMFLPVKVKFNSRGPAIYLKSGSSMNRLSEESCVCIDEMDIDYVDLDIRPYKWDINDDSGITAYLDSMCVVQNVDRFAAMFKDDTE